MTKKNECLLGTHVSIAGGFFKAIEEGTELNCTAVQIFTKSNRQWKSKPIADSEAQLFIAAQKKSNIKIVVSHASYLINLGSVTPGVQEKSLIALVDEIRRCHQLQIPFLVLHPGTAEPENKDETLQKTGDYIDQALRETSDCSTTVLIETMAGQGKSVGSSFEELAKIIKQVKNAERIGICFDTCHIFAAGYDVTTPQGYTDVIQKFDSIVGLRHLKIIHINDSKRELNSRVDRHENIGEGAMGLQAFSMIMNDQKLKDVPKILETPKGDDLENDRKNIGMLQGLLNKKQNGNDNSTL